MSAAGPPNFSSLVQANVYDQDGNIFGRVQSVRYDRDESNCMLLSFRVRTRHDYIVDTPMIAIPDNLSSPISILANSRSGVLTFLWSGNSTTTGFGTILRPSEFARQYEGLFEPATPKKKYPEMKCAGCQSKIHNPDHLEKHLSPEQAEKYIQYCKKNQTEPTLYCCGCFDVIKNSRYFLTAWLELIRQMRKNEELEEKLEQLLSRAEKTHENAMLIEQTYNKKLDELKKNPLKLVLAEITGITIRKKRSVGAIIKKYYGRDVMIDEALFANNKKLKLRIWHKIIGLQLIRQEIINSSVIGYSHLHFGFGKPKEGQTLPSIPIPFMRNPHCIKFI